MNERVECKPKGRYKISHLQQYLPVVRYDLVLKLNQPENETCNNRINDIIFNWNN